MTAILNTPDMASHDLLQPVSEAVPLYTSETYTAYGEDLDFMWRWRIYRDNKLVQEGCSLTLDASRRAVRHVLSFFNIERQSSQEP